ncbi:hypothetical protein AUK40_00815 [Candidatus Wirthbacteria bacterium CG2_30_54_11]|uniref:AB hydrolase-1 domain-containing protein n=1 Tax=Candidatus Wirthbacteria bacterium CG2_30_54_11 TaxID=1817892 RepID=A0A1J5IR26_9BACT|nr:MAG: hypothetical protein AUK40_00815 [Candidatus Wirthbacteria bacterium CG2_30_54_11]
MNTPEIAGSEKPVIVVFPGFALSEISFDRAFRPLKQEGYTVLVISPRLPLSGDVPSALNRNRTFVESHLAVKAIKEWIAVGVSFGGIIATDCAANSSLPPARLVLIDSGGKNPKRHLFAWLHELNTQIWKTFKARKGATIGLYVVTDLVVTTFLHPITTLRAAWISKGYDIDALASKVKISTDIIWGQHDKLAPASIASQMAGSFTNCRVHLVPGDHNWIHFHAERLLDILEKTNARSAG